MKKLTLPYILAFNLVLLMQPLSAVVIADSTLPVDSTVIQIAADYGISNGTVSGENLFHSFSEFSLAAGESASFDFGAGISNVFARVTGNSISNINGAVNFSLPAALFFINPNGVILGNQASLNINGSFFVGTPDYISFEDGGRFDASNPANDVLSSDYPAAFGFIDQAIGSVLIDGTDFSTTFSASDNLAIVGGDITVTNGSRIVARGGRIDLVSLSSAGEVKPPSGSAEPVLEGFSSYGDVAVSGSSGINVSNNAASGDIYIRSGNFILDHSGVRTDTVSGPGGEIRIRCGQCEIRNAAVISANTEGSGKGGDISIRADSSILVRGLNGEPTAIRCATASTGDAGSITLDGGMITVSDRASISGATQGSSGKGADINISAGDRLTISERGSINTITTRSGQGGVINISSPRLDITSNGAVVASSMTSGNGGKINLSVTDLSMDKGLIAAESNGTGTGGEITISALNSVRLTGANEYSSGGNNGQLIRTSSNDSGDGGTLHIRTSSMNIRDGAQITAATRGTGNGGRIFIEADNLEISNSYFMPSRETGIDSSGDTSEPARAGNLILHIHESLLLSGRNGLCGINTSVSQACTGGYLEIIAKDITLEEGALIYGKTVGSGQSGTIFIKAENEMNISGRNPFFDVSSQISSGTESAGNGGNMVLLADRFVLRDHGLVESTTLAGGRAGHIEISAGNLELENMGSITCNTFSTGPGGSVNIDSGELRMDAESFITAASFSGGDSGYIGINSENCTISGGAQINNSAFSSGNGGTIDLQVRRLLRMDGLFSGLVSKSSSGSSGDAGYINVNAGTLALYDHAVITTTSEGSGHAGNIDVTAGNIEFQGSSMSSVSEGSGNAGSISIHADSSIRLKDSTVSVHSEFSDGGNIDLRAEYELYLEDSTISASVKGGSGNGGNISIDPVYVILINSRIIANAFGGSGGNIFIDAMVFLKDIRSTVSASSRLGIDGMIEISAPDIDISNTLMELPDSFEEIGRMLPERCTNRHAGEYGSFIITGKTFLPGGPDSVREIP